MLLVGFSDHLGFQDVLGRNLGSLFRASEMFDGVSHLGRFEVEGLRLQGKEQHVVGDERSTGPGISIEAF